MRVWRVAHETCRDSNGFPTGPYTGEGLTREIQRDMDEMRWSHNDDNHPSPRWDVTLDYHIGREEHCGFDSLDALNRWFEPYWRVMLFANGFKVHTYEVPDEYARTGAVGQTLFDRNFARLINITDLTD